MIYFFRTAAEYDFTSEEPIEMNGASIKPAEFLLTGLNRKLSSKPKKNEDPVFSIQVIVTGKKDGKDVKYTLTKTGHDDMAYLTSIPAAAGAMQILEGKVDVNGVIAPECLNPREMIKFLTEINYIKDESDYNVERKIGDEVVIGSIRENAKFPELY